MKVLNILKSCMVLLVFVFSFRSPFESGAAIFHHVPLKAKEILKGRATKEDHHGGFLRFPQFPQSLVFHDIKIKDLLFRNKMCLCQYLKCEDSMNSNIIP